MESHEINNIALNAVLKSCISTTNEAEKLRNLQEEKDSKLTIGAFFEFMRTAYQVNDSCEGLATILSANSEIDWQELTKINLDLNTHEDNKIINNNCNLNTQEQQHNDSIQELLLQITSNKEASSSTSNSTISSQSCTISCNTIYEACNKVNSMQESNSSESVPNQCLETRDNIGEVNQLLESCQTFNEKRRILQFKEHSEESEHGLAKVMKESLRDILHEGLLDSVLPYMLPKSSLSQPVIKKSTIVTDVKKNSSLCNVIENKATSSIHKERDKEKNKINKKSLENDVEIHVCDEDKNIKKNFRCPQKLLIQKMCYFADVTAGQKLDEIDISVHCDVVIFDWLMRWVKKDIIKKSEWPVLEASNVIPIMVSACFLQMEPLLENCLQYCHDNMSDILKTSTILSCLDDNLLTRLAELFTNEDVEMLKDKKDKIQSRLFCKLIISLIEATPDNKKGHYSSLAMLFKCGKCNRNVIQSISDFVPCVPSAMKIDNKGAVCNKHVRDLTWTLNDYIITLRSELRSWRKVYWRLWGDCHFLFCQQCNVYFPIHQIDWCCYHPESAQFFVNEQQRPTPIPLGRYPCCSQRAYRFEVLSSQGGCRYKEHVPNIKSEKELNILNILTANKEIITIEPPQLFFPEKITRLVTRDPSLRPGKLVCKDIMWWNGIELVPPRPKLGLLGKIWGSSGFRRLLETQDSQKSLQKLRRQISTTTTDILSSASSMTDEDDEDDGGTAYEDSSIDDESYYSEESNTLCALKPMNKAKHNQKSNSRCWSGNLNVRHNQDNQRDFEERAAVQMIILLTKRTMTENLLSKSYSKQQHSYKAKQPIGGTYMKLEAEFREQLAQSCKYKNPLIGKTRMKSNKS
ncbi:SANT and BTB domain regulator of class switch recombination isoform X2 [Cataglyphis hispanica]|nr:SANT and BTB domain regulator of class switch recombination isoform X2 [Cataglyphis hispanica]XP_050458908.1 SANT and BTB domain regulator of class switch recombination isoform X2 [Cataglyphis hispanica]XP_050458909.1 SANT and BTB domain regulator of class switch recombination isoform X2 [Cataglyphis hispanica]